MDALHEVSSSQFAIHAGIGETYLVGGQTEDISNLEVVKKILAIMEKKEDFYVANLEELREALKTCKLNPMEKVMATNLLLEG